jgi:hypothetical protein
MLILDQASDLPTWNAEELGNVLDEVLTSAPALRVDWELEAGEGWARIWSESDLCALVRAPTTANRATRFGFCLARMRTAR